MEDLGHVTLGQPDRPLRLLQVTDLHHFPAGCRQFTNNKGRVVPLAVPDDPSPEGAYDPQTAFKVMESILARTKPDVVMLTGDIIDGRPFGAIETPDPEGWRTAMLSVLAPIVAAGASWTFVPGNHDDDQCPWTRDDLLGIFQLGDAAPGCISAGATSFNHTVSIGPGAACTPDALRLWLFDSGGNHLEDPSLRYHTFGAEAVEGYRSLAPKLPRAGCDLAYFHIPLPQCAGLDPLAGHHGLFDAALRGGQVPRPWCWQPFTAVVRLLGKDRVSGSSKLESGLFDAFVEQGAVRACFFGHDHYSDAVMRRDGIYLVYGRVSASTPPSNWEGAGGPLPFDIGARLVEWSAEGDLRTCVETMHETEPASAFRLSAAAA